MFDAALITFVDESMIDKRDRLALEKDGRDWEKPDGIENFS